MAASVAAAAGAAAAGAALAGVAVAAAALGGRLEPAEHMHTHAQAVTVCHHIHRLTAAAMIESETKQIKGSFPTTYALLLAAAMTMVVVVVEEASTSGDILQLRIRGSYTSVVRYMISYSAELFFHGEICSDSIMCCAVRFY